MFKVKICGITNLQDARLAIKSGADAVGFIFAKSPRRISITKAAQIAKEVAGAVNIVGVFVDTPKNKIKKIIKQCRLDYIQLHGNESPEFCSSFKNIKIIKTIHVQNKDSFKGISAYKVSAILLDTYVYGKQGGTGKSFDWRLIKDIKQPLILSGGLNAGNVKKAIKIVKPHAVDVCSGVERAFGKKDPRKLKQFLKNLKPEA